MQDIAEHCPNDPRVSESWSTATGMAASPESGAKMERMLVLTTVEG
jgi:hypothetical protein